MYLALFSAKSCRNCSAPRVEFILGFVSGSHTKTTAGRFPSGMARSQHPQVFLRHRHEISGSRFPISDEENQFPAFCRLKSRGLKSTMGAEVFLGYGIESHPLHHLLRRT